MFVSKALSVNSENHLEIGGVDCLELVKQFGTPLYVLDEKTIRENSRLYIDSINKAYDGKDTVL